MDGEQTGETTSSEEEEESLTNTNVVEYIWGVIDMIPETNFPDIRSKTAVHSTNGSCMVIPREGDVVRLYIQLTDAEVLDSAGRVDKSKIGPQKLLEVARKSMHPYTIKTDEFLWWTIYISASPTPWVVRC